MSWGTSARRGHYLAHREEILAKKAGERRAAGAKEQHRLSYNPVYRTWQFVKDRCHNPKSVHYDRYGGRGIRMHEAWLNDPAAFVEYMGPKPSPRHSIDRFPNRGGNYEPGNVRWATYAEQNQNRSCSKLDATDVRFIRHWLTRGHTQRSIAVAFNVNASLISAIKTGHLWASPSEGR